MASDEESQGLDVLYRQWIELQNQRRFEEAQALQDCHPGLTAFLVLAPRANRDGSENGHDLPDTKSMTPTRLTSEDGRSERRMTSGGAFDELRFHASGGLGEVYQARQAELNRDVALKFLKPKRADDHESLRRFLLEAEVTGRLEHPGVVPVYGMGRDEDGSPCYAMRFIRGQTLQDALDAFHLADKPDRDPSERSLAFRGLLRRFISVCNTIAYAHSRGILHRDIKPRNIMLGRYDETLVVDWGLAKSFDRGESRGDSTEETLSPGSGSGHGSPSTVGAVGTPSYMSPEQINGEPQGPGSDVYGLGATLYALLTSQPPLRGDNLRIISERIRRRDFPRPRQLKPSVSAALEAICLKAMEPLVEDRYHTALEMAQDLELWMADEPVSAWNEPAFLRTSRWLRRHQTILAAGLALTASGLVAAVVILLLVNASKEREHEKFELARGTINRFLIFFADQRFAHIPDFQAQREPMAAEAVQFNEGFLAERGDDPTTRREAAGVFLKAANIYRYIGKFDRAQALYERSVELYNGLVSSADADRQDRRFLAEVKTDQAVSLRLSGRPADALKVFRETVALSEALPGVHSSGPKTVRRPSSPFDQDESRTLGRALLDLANLLAETGNFEEAKQAASRSVDILSGLVKGRPPQPQMADRLLVLALLIRGEAEGELGDRPAALSTLASALELTRELGRLAPKDIDFKHLTARSYIAQGKFLFRDEEEMKNAADAFSKAAEIEAELVAEFPVGVVYKVNQAIALGGLGRSRARLGSGSLEAAESSSRQARTLLEKLVRESQRVPGVRDNLALVLLDLSAIAETKGDRENAAELKRLAEREVQLAINIYPGSPVAKEALRRLRKP